MKQIQIKRITLTDDYRQNGFYLGELARDSFPHILDTLQLLDPYGQCIDEIKDVIQKYCPQLLEEIQGIQEGLQLPEDMTLRFFSGYGMPQFKGMGCTSLMTSEYYVRNYDFSPVVYDHLFIKQSNEYNRIFGNAQFLVGRLDGMNRDGLVVGLHFVNNDQYGKGFLCSMIVRIVLEMCSSVKEAIELLQSIPHAASYNYSLLDRSGEFAVVEASPLKSDVLRGEHMLSCVNMFLSQNMKRFNQKSIRSSTERLDELVNVQVKSKKVLDFHNWFSDPTSPMFYTDYEAFFGTLHTVSYVPETKQILLTEAGGELSIIKM